MRTKTVPLDKGVKVGEVYHNVAVIKAPNALDVINAMRSSELLVSAPVHDEAGNVVRVEPQFISSPTNMAIEVMLGQIVSIGVADAETPLFKAPIDESILDKLSPEDLNIIRYEAELLENASAAEVAARGRLDAQSENADNSD